MRRLFMFGLLVATAVAAASAGVPTAELRSLAGIYSSLTLNQESGDLTGLELLLVPEGDLSHYAAAVQLAEGQSPQLAIAHVEVQKDAFTLSFKPEGVGAPITFTCKVSVSGLTCVNGASTEKLKRGKSYWL